MILRNDVHTDNKSVVLKAASRKRKRPRSTNRILSQAKRDGFVHCGQKSVQRCMNLVERGLLLVTSAEYRLFTATPLLLEREEDDIVSFLRSQAQWDDEED